LSRFALAEIQALLDRSAELVDAGRAAGVYFQASRYKTGHIPVGVVGAVGTLVGVFVVGRMDRARC
jgi:hypothetical protein